MYLITYIIEVTDWMSLGLSLKLPSYELEGIRQDGYNLKDRLQRMVSLWLTLVESSCSSSLQNYYYKSYENVSCYAKHVIIKT